MLTVAIPVFQRHDLLERCLASLRACPEFDQGVAMLLLVPDYGEEREALASLLARHGFPHALVTATPERRLYCDGNTLSARELAFVRPATTHVLTLDSDLLVSPTFLTHLLRAHAWVSTQHPCIVQSSVTCTASVVFKRELAGFLSTGFATGNMHFMDRAVWARIQPFLHSYRDRFLHIPPRERDNPAMWAWFAEASIGATPWCHERLLPYRYSSCGLAHDAATYVAALRADILPVHTAVNHAINIGEVGENMTPEQFDALRKVRLDTVEVSSSFRWWPTPHPLTCQQTLSTLPA